MSDLTDEDRAAIANASALYETGFRAGAAAMRERAAKVCTGLHNMDRPYDERSIDACIAAIRALPLTEDK